MLIKHREALPKPIYVLLIVLFCLLSFYLGINYQKNIDNVRYYSFSNSKKGIVIPSPTFKPIGSPNRAGWYRFIGKNYDYLIDYPKNYSYSIDDKGAISFEKVVDYPHRTDSWIFINKNLLDREELIALNTMKLGEKRIIKKEGTTIPDNFNVYERLPNKMFGDKEAKSFVNKNIWEGDQLYLYLLV